MSRSISPSLLVVSLVMVVTVFVGVKWSWDGGDGEGWRMIIRSDARGYYGYLTALFIRGDLGNEPFAHEYIHRTPTGTLNKYFSGTAIFMAPAFLAGHALAQIDPDAPKDGSSEYEMKAISIVGWVYLLLGMLALRALLSGLQVREEVVAWLLLMVGVGSTLLQYSAIQPGWSHVYSFFALSTFFLCLQRLSIGASPRLLLGAAFLFGLILLVRPVNVLVLLGLPVVLGDGTLPFLRRMIRHWHITLLVLLLFFLVIFLQPLLWHLQTGNWLEWGYRNEGFYWDRPEILNVLFSFRRGLFIWTPMFLLAAICIPLLWRFDRSRAIWSLIYWGVNVYVISAWWIWYYGSGFGSRVFIDHYPVMIIPLALILDRASRIPWSLSRIFFVMLLILHSIQFIQYQRGILHHELMDRQKYAFTFMKLDPRWAHMTGGKWEVPPYSPEGLELILQAATDLERTDRYWFGGAVVRDHRAYSGDHVNIFDEDHEFGVSFNAAPGTIPTGRELWLEVRLMRYEEVAESSLPAIAITTVEREDGSKVFYQGFKMNQVPGKKDRHWEALEYRIPVPALEQGDKMRFYIWNEKGGGRFLIDDLFIRVWAARPYSGMMRPRDTGPATRR